MGSFPGTPQGCMSCLLLRVGRIQSKRNLSVVDKLLRLHARNVDFVIVDGGHSLAYVIEGPGTRRLCLSGGRS